MGVPVILGPHTYNFAQAAKDAIAAGAALRASDAREALTQAQRLLQDMAPRKQMGEAALRFAAMHCGATARTLTAIEEQHLAS